MPPGRAAGIFFSPLFPDGVNYVKVSIISTKFSPALLWGLPPPRLGKVSSYLLKKKVKHYVWSLHQRGFSLRWPDVGTLSRRTTHNDVTPKRKSWYVHSKLYLWNTVYKA